MSNEMKPRATDKDLVSPEPASGLKRSHQVKVTLNESELEFLDRVVLQMGSDRSSAFRHLLRMAAGGAFSEPDKSSSFSKEIGLTSLKPTLARDEEKRELGGVKMLEPRNFDSVPAAVTALRENKIIILNVTLIEPDQGQRCVDFVAGGNFALDGHSERVGAGIFLFAPSSVPVEAVAAASIEAGMQQVKGTTPPKISETYLADPAKMMWAMPDAGIASEEIDAELLSPSAIPINKADEFCPEDIS